MIIFTARKRSCGKVMFLQLSVILFMGGSASVHAGIPHPPAQYMLGDMPNKWVVRIVLECNLVWYCRFANRQHKTMKVIGQFKFSVRKRSCGKVMFSQARVKNSVYRWGRCTPPPADTPQMDTPMARPPRQMAIGADSTHPTGMHSCFTYKSPKRTSGIPHSK